MTYEAQWLLYVLQEFFIEHPSFVTLFTLPQIQLLAEDETFRQGRSHCKGQNQI